LDTHPNAQLDFSNRVALITGGASGIGFAVATQLLELGASIAIADVNFKSATRAAEKLGIQGNAIAIEVDVSDHEDCQSMVDTAVSALGKIDILVHCAGVGIEKSFLDTSPEE